MIFRIGRMAARSGGQPQGPAPYGCLGRLICLLILIAVCDRWWRAVACFAVALTLVMIPVVACKMSGQRRDRERGSDPLDDLMRGWEDRP